MVGACAWKTPGSAWATAASGMSDAAGVAKATSLTCVDPSMAVVTGTMVIPPSSDVGPTGEAVLDGTWAGDDAAGEGVSVTPAADDEP